MIYANIIQITISQISCDFESLIVFKSSAVSHVTSLSRNLASTEADGGYADSGVLAARAEY